jgi:hypothetical protein
MRDSIIPELGLVAVTVADRGRLESIPSSPIVSPGITVAKMSSVPSVAKLETFSSPEPRMSIESAGAPATYTT